VTDHGTAPILVRQNDGRLEPLEPDRVSRALFAATDLLGTPDAFLARELADAIIPALAAEMQSPITIQELTDSVAKYVRELGHPAIARGYREQIRLPNKHDGSSIRPPHLWQIIDPNSGTREVHRRLAEPALRELATSDVFPLDIVSMVRDGLMQLQGLEHPFELAGSVLGDGLRTNTAGLGIASAFENTERHTGGFVVIDSPEHALAALAGEPRQLVAEFLDEWRRGLATTGLVGTIHLNHGVAPAWASDPQTGPLFGGLAKPTDAGRIGEMAITIATVASETTPISWHLSRADLAGEPSPSLVRIIESIRGGRAIELVFDRARQPVSLGPGLTRSDPAVLLFVGIHLARFAEQISSRTPERFLQKLGSLARLARSAGHAKFDFLRRHGKPEVKRGFRLERARLVVTPVGLEETVRIVADLPACDLGPGTEFARMIVVQLMNALTREQPRNLEAVLDSFAAISGFGSAKVSPARRDVAGLTAWDESAPQRQQMQASGETHAAANAGTAAILVPAAMPSVDEYVQLLRLAAQSDVRRVRFVSQGGVAPD